MEHSEKIHDFLSSVAWSVKVTSASMNHFNMCLYLSGIYENLLPIPWLGGRNVAPESQGRRFASYRMTK